jgi:addiction module RelE/StbE family toxin
MINLLYGKHFFKSAKKISGNQQEKLAELLTILKQNPFDSRLHTKTLSGRFSGCYSFRITRDWRVVFQFNSPRDIKLIELGNRKDIYK